jgi:TonB family protein
MRPTLLASLLLSPMLVAASAVASQPKSDAPAPAEYHRISTGIAVPAIVDSTFRIPAGSLGETGAASAKVVLSLNVDEKGNAKNVRVVKSANPTLDARVVTAVLQSHFRPATLDHQAIAVDMDLTVSVLR